MTADQTESRAPVDRPAGRIVLLDREGRILLFKVREPGDGTELWLTPGGGLLPGESYEAAARRELFEETGIRAEVGPCVWTWEEVFTWNHVLHRAPQRFFLVRARSSLIDVTGFDAVEASFTLGHRWWSAAEIEASDELFVPERLAEHLRPLVEGQVPPTPVDLRG